MGIFVQRSRIRRSLREVVPEPQRVLRRISRRKYYCRSPLSVIHIDGYHKLIRLVQYNHTVISFCIRLQAV